MSEKLISNWLEHKVMKETTKNGPYKSDFELKNMQLNHWISSMKKNFEQKPLQRIKKNDQYNSNFEHML